MIEELKIAQRWNDSLAANPEQAWTEISVLVPDTITRDELRAILQHHWKLVQTVEVRLERHREAQHRQREPWDKLYEVVRTCDADGLIQPLQWNVFLDIWWIVSATPGLRCPSMMMLMDSNIHLSWTFKDMIGQSLTIDITPTGHIDWFWRSNGAFGGTEDAGPWDEHSKAIMAKLQAFVTHNEDPKQVES